MNAARDAAHHGPRAITIVLADDLTLVRAGLRLLLEAEADLTVVGEAGDLAATEERVGALAPSVLVLDISMPPGSSLPAIARLRAQSPQTRIVLLSARQDPDLAREALRSGGSGYVLKGAQREDLVAAIRLAAAGQTYLDPQLDARAVTRRTDDPPDGLSAREIEVLGLLASGYTNAEIATQLYLSVRTVESHRARLQQKTQLASRAQLVAYARDHQLI